MHFALMQNVLTSTNMNVRKHFIKCAIPYICIEMSYLVFSIYHIYNVFYKRNYKWLLPYN